MTGLWIVLMILCFSWKPCFTHGAGFSVSTLDTAYRHGNPVDTRYCSSARNNLRIELARLKSPERIETIARNRLGLVMPDEQADGEIAMTTTGTIRTRLRSRHRRCAIFLMAVYRY
jgi:hypothetical protein